MKIDQSFSRNVHTNEASKAIIEAVCQLARRLSMNVVVEGIETDQQRIAVQLLGRAAGPGLSVRQARADGAVHAGARTRRRLNRDRFTSFP